MKTWNNIPLQTFQNWLTNNLNVLRTLLDSKIAIFLVIVAITISISAAAVLLGMSSTQVYFSPQHKPKTAVMESPDQCAPANPATVPEENTTATRVVGELRQFNDWLNENSASGFIGEVGWPADTPVENWSSVADKWYAETARTSVWTTAWATGSSWGNYNLLFYDNADRSVYDIDKPLAQSEILEKYATSCSAQHGINIAGMEFGVENDQFSNSNRGVPGSDYFYEPDSTLRFLSERGIKIIRLPFRWERIQPVLQQPLDANEIVQLRRLLDAAAANDQRIVLDLHNYGEYRTQTGRLQIGDGVLSANDLSNVWLRLSKEFKDHPGLLAYGLMNEPHGLPYDSRTEAAEAWEKTSQEVLNSLRNNGDNTLIMIPGYDWSSLSRWTENHPDAWIDDPADNFRYEAHHYWDDFGRGSYAE